MNWETLGFPKLPSLRTLASFIAFLICRLFLGVPRSFANLGYVKYRCRKWTFFLICAFLHLTNASWAPQCTDVLLGPGDSDRSLAVCPHGAKSSKWSKICQPPRVGMGFPGDSAVRNAPVMQETQEMWV